MEVPSVEHQGGIMRWIILKPASIIVGWSIGLLTLTTALLGGLQFFLATGASPRYVLQRKRWFESTMLGKPMGVRGFLAFGLWAAENGRTNHWP